MLKANYDDVSDCKAYLKEQPERERGGGLNFSLSLSHFASLNMIRESAMPMVTST